MAPVGFDRGLFTGLARCQACMSLVLDLDHDRKLHSDWHDYIELLDTHEHDWTTLRKVHRG